MKLSAVEELIITVLVVQRRPLYGLEIIQQINEAADKHSVSFGSLYPALKRLEIKGFLESNWGEETLKERGGARRKYYSVTSDGREAFETVRSIRNSLLSPVPA